MFALRYLALPLSLSAFLLPSASLAALAEEDLAAKQVELKKGDRIIFFGDSLTNLAGEEKPKEHVTKGYVRIVRETLQAKHPDKKIEVDWVATGGHTVPDLLKRVDKDVIAKKPTIVVIQIGCNDARRIPKETFKTSLEELIDKLQKAGIQVVQCSLTSVGEKHDGTNKDDPKLDEFAEVRAGGRQGEEGPAQRPAQGVRRPLEEEQSRQQAQRHPHLRRQPLQPDRAWTSSPSRC